MTNMHEPLWQNSDYSVREYVARDSNTPAEILVKLAEDAYNTVRQAVAENPNTPSETLKQLALDEDQYWRVRYGALRNPSFPASNVSARTLYKLAEEDEAFRDAVATYPCTPVAILTMLAVDSTWSVRLEVARNSSALPETLTQLALEDAVDDVREAALHNPSLPANLRAMAALAE